MQRPKFFYVNIFFIASFDITTLNMVGGDNLIWAPGFFKAGAGTEVPLQLEFLSLHIKNFINFTWKMVLNAFLVNTIYI